MIELLVDCLKPRVFAAVAAVALAAWLAGRYGGYPKDWYSRWRHPPAGPAAGGEDIAAALDAHQSRRLHRIYARVSGEIAAARARGLDVTGFQEAADAALALDNPRYRDAAIERLNRLSLAVPQKAEDARPAGEDSGQEDELATPAARPVRGRRK